MVVGFGVSPDFFADHYPKFCPAKDDAGGSLPRPFLGRPGPALLPPGEGHLLGTDDMGVDLWAQICYGARTSLLIGAATALLAGLGGGIVGILAGYMGGMVEKFILRLIDVLLVLPDLPLLILLAAFLGAGLENIILVLALFSWSRPARIVRAQVLSLRQQTYIQAARYYGAGTFYLLWRHFLPELMPLLLVHKVRLASRGITAEAGLAFLGLGDPTANSWGMILHYATGFRGIYFTPYWKWWLLYPCLALTLLVIGLALFGRDLERIKDPRLRFRRPIV